ncbi:hypothetical protein [Planotetraspora kaengkrachanensis]|uniref:Uncharacterized protein n=1 Tax=Planotetraspora kaengkrachanensis TaxID=575193 RepID=A0A8J3LUX5_9ACTN|nr:hypothetical protein [Planotetraspora kaengkrachanensis]GIG77240.1 hypothetical protein Pka01_03670 [Planotetraspora kaengkrachanensis]
MPDAFSERPIAWLTEQTAEFETLAGRAVERWRGVEMAIREGTSDGPEFSDPDVSCLQLLRLQVTLAGGDHRTIDTYQNDDCFGLRVAGSAHPHAQEWTGIYRESELSLPVGRIDAVTVRHERGMLAEVTLSIGRATILVIAAEIYELDNGSLEWHRFDESVMVFPDPAEADKIEWTPPRSSLERRL